MSASTVLSALALAASVTAIVVAISGNNDKPGAGDEKQVKDNPQIPANRVAAVGDDPLALERNFARTEIESRTAISTLQPGSSIEHAAAGSFPSTRFGARTFRLRLRTPRRRFSSQFSGTKSWIVP